jgi:hypothetical protein
MYALPFCEAPIADLSFRAAGASAMGCVLGVESDLVGEDHFRSSASASFNFLRVAQTIQACGEMSEQSSTGLEPFPVLATFARC